jgi:hypothetical protein
MAKSRKTRPVKRKTGTKVKAAPARKVAAKKGKAKRTKRAPATARKVDLKQLREEFSKVLVVLSSKRSASPEVTTRLDDARRRVSQWMTDIDDICSPEDQEICGPDMAIPIP